MTVIRLLYSNKRLLLEELNEMYNHNGTCIICLD